MGKHSNAARRTSRPREITRLEPVSESRETPQQALRRQRDIRRSPAEMARRRQRTRRVAFGCLSLLLVLIAVAIVGAYAWMQWIDRQMASKSGAQNRGVDTTLAPPRKPSDPFYMVLLGEDKRPGEVRARSDTLMVAYVDPPNRKIKILSIPRDTRVDIPGHGKNKINAAMQLGGATLVIETIKDFTGLPISHYMELDFNGFKDLVDAIGGVWVDVPMNINDDKAANHDWRSKIISKGYQRLDGPHALTFVRTRHLAGDDFTRIKDQQIFLKALAKQTLTIKNVVNFPKIVNAVMKNVTTDMNVGQLLNLAADFKGMDSGSVEGTTVPGVPKYINGISYVVPDEEALSELVRRIEMGESIEPSSAPKGSNIGSVTKATDVTVSVRNGAGQQGLAAEVAAVLKKRGFRIKEVGNTGRPVYNKTLVVFRDSDPKAKLVHDTLGFGTVVHGSGIYQFDTDILVVVGKDWRKQFPKASSP